jgi:hypothetical protein
VERARFPAPSMLQLRAADYGQGSVLAVLSF